MPSAYSDAGVDIEAGYEVVRRIRSHADRTKRPGVMGGIGGFGGLFDLSSLGVREPVLVSGTDGVGTKLLVAAAAGKHDTIGIDCVAMCVNDVIAQGAQPLFFLDYVACGANDPALLEQVVAGVAQGCVEAGAALVGGETAEMPGMYDTDEYDLAGFTVGVVEKSRLIDGSRIAAGDVLIGLASSGIHSNGFSLARKALFEKAGFSVDSTPPQLGGHSLSEVLLTPTAIYVSALTPLLDEGLIHGVSHITGGGFIENIPRMLPDSLAACIDPATWAVPAIFNLIEESGNVPHSEMFNVFNMGVGMVLAVSLDDADHAIELLAGTGHDAWVIGDVTERRDEATITFSQQPTER